MISQHVLLCNRPEPARALQAQSHLLLSGGQSRCTLLPLDFAEALAQCWAQISHLLLAAKFLLLLFVLAVAKDSLCLLINLFLYPLSLYPSIWFSLLKSLFLSLSSMLLSAQLLWSPPAYLSYLYYHEECQCTSSTNVFPFFECPSQSRHNLFY